MGAIGAWALAALLCAAGPAEPFGVQVVDSETGRGVPLVELETVNQQLFVTDSAGWVAIDAPDLMEREVYFYVRSHGYEYPADGFGFRGTRLSVEPGGRARLELKRHNIAERLYRVTGGGIYRDSIALGLGTPIKHPLANAQVWGSDSVLSAVYRGKVFWFWGDTNRPSYPLGNFHVPGATSELPAVSGLAPAVGIDLNYFVADDGFAKPTARLPGEGPTWLGSLVVLEDETATPRLFAHYVKVRQSMEIYEWGLVRFDDEQQQFEIVSTFPIQWPIRPVGAHPVVHPDPAGEAYVYFATPLPHERVRATTTALADPEQYEAYTCLAEGSTAQQPQVRRTADGKLDFAWARKAPALNEMIVQQLIASGQLRRDELPRTFVDVPDGERLEPHRGSVAWNDYRRRWVMIFTQAGGRTSNIGETWYAEADQLTGPWHHPRKIVTHDKYSFYNPRHHPFFDQHGGRVVYFEGTYTQAFSGASRPTPLYDYNQVMYRLDLAAPRLQLPAPGAPAALPSDDR